MQQLEQGLGNSSVKTQKVDILGFENHTVSVSTAQLCLCSMKAAVLAQGAFTKHHRLTGWLK